MSPGIAAITVTFTPRGTGSILESTCVATVKAAETPDVPVPTVNVKARNVTSGEAGVQLTAVVENDTDLPIVGTLIAAVYLDGRFLDSSLLPGLTVLPEDSAEVPMEVLCHASGYVTVKVFYVAADSMVPLAANAN